MFQKLCKNTVSLISLSIKCLLSKWRLILKRTEPEYQGNTSADLHAKTVPTKSIKIVAQVHEVHFASAKMALPCQILPSCYPCSMGAICS